MAREGSVAPKERVNIVYKPATGNAQEEVELPLKVLMMGDYIGRTDDRPLEERKPINVDKDNFKDVMAGQKLKVQVTVPDKLAGEANAEMTLNLEFKGLGDFEPEGVVRQVPELKKLLELRAALNALKGPLGNIPAFRKKLQGLLGDTTSRQKLMQELGILADSGEKPST
jgi:type VI secretion system protein ImpB